MYQRGQAEPKPRGGERTPSGRSSLLGRALPAGFALMSLVPILLAVWLLGERREMFSLETLAGRGGAFVFLMMLSAITGFTLIRRELLRVFRDARRDSREATAEELTAQLREASQEEIRRISDALRDLAPEPDEREESPPVPSAPLRGGIARLTQVFATARAPRQFQEGLVAGAREAVEARTAYLMEVDPEAGEFVTVAASGKDEQLARDRRIPLGDGLPGRAARERRPLLIGAGSDVDDDGEKWTGLRKEARSILVVPMIRGEQVASVLLLEDRADGGEHTREDLAVVADLGSLVASSIFQQEASRRREQAHEDTVRAFAHLVESRDPYSRGHSSRVARYCEEMALTLRMDDDTVRTLRTAALLHDIGKLSIPEDLLRKDGRYSKEERTRVRDQVVAAECKLSDLPGLAAVAPLVQGHHELCDGSGYPQGLKGDAIPLTTHILIVANAFDVMTSDRSFREALPLATALEILKSKAGTWYDRRAVQALLGLDEDVLSATGQVEREGSEVHQGTAAVSVRD